MSNLPENMNNNEEELAKNEAQAENQESKTGKEDAKAKKAEEKAKKKEQLAKEKEESRKILEKYKADKKAIRNAKRKVIPTFVKVLRIIGVCLVPILLVAALSVEDILIALGNQAAQNFQDEIYACERFELEELREGYVIDTASADEIRAMEKNDPNDTWGIYIYMVGSDLESMGQNDLNTMVSLMSATEAAENKSETSKNIRGLLGKYQNTIEEAGLELPSPMYDVQKPIYSETHTEYVTNTVVVADMDGAATTDINEIIAAQQIANSDKVEVVIQTGGAKHWTDNTINPNRVQRFHVKNGRFEEEESYPSFNMATRESVADFLKYCNEKHDADHKIVVFWDHGGGTSGYGQDEIYNSILSISDMKGAFSDAVKADPENPPYDIIGFDACLMATAEVVSAFDGYGKYFVGSEETEPGQGWYYIRWLRALAEDPSMNAAEVGLNIVDSYMDCYAGMDKSEFMQQIGYSNRSVCLSLLDISATTEVYDAYEELVDKVLEDTAKDSDALTNLSRAAKGSLHYGSSSYDCFNLVDLGLMCDNLTSYYPNEAAKIKQAMDKAVVYNRAANSLEESQGLSIFYPSQAKNINTVYSVMDYIENFTEDESLKALYFYKIAGCLTDEMEEALKAEGKPVLEALDTSSLNELEKAAAEITSEGNFSVAVNESAEKLIEDYYLSVARIDYSDHSITDYGMLNCVDIKDGKMNTAFDGKWLCLEGQPLAPEIVNDTNSGTTYRAPVLIDGSDGYLMFYYNKADGSFDITGGYLTDEEDTADLIGRNVSDLSIGSKITPVYEYALMDNQTVGRRTGKAVKYKEDTTVEMKSLANGEYLSAIRFNDVRGDAFNTGVVGFDMANGAIKNTAINADFVAQ
ncbi:MAG: hypothetical protein J5997_08660 [Oscillospiraceae bacterium]|nr:hypothetical protein [Oscillospiraceae bacterium]